MVLEHPIFFLPFLGDRKIIFNIKEDKCTQNEGKTPTRKIIRESISWFETITPIVVAVSFLLFLKSCVFNFSIIKKSSFQIPLDHDAEFGVHDIINCFKIIKKNGDCAIHFTLCTPQHKYNTCQFMLVVFSLNLADPSLRCLLCAYVVVFPHATKQR